MQRKRVSTRRLSIRPMVKADYATWRAAVMSPNDSRFEDPPRSARRSSKAAFDKILVRHARSARIDRMYVFSVFLKGRRELVGVIDITVLQRGPLQLANLGYRVFQPYRRRGYAKEAVLATMHLAFESLQLNRLEAVLDFGNRPSRALARALGMSRECVRRKYFFQDGRFHDQEIWSAQREDFGHAPLLRLR